jgi:hypothetical protein
MNTDTTQPSAPTPETDQYVSPCIVFHGPQTVSSMVLADFARKLERERDQLREVAKRLGRLLRRRMEAGEFTTEEWEALAEFDRLKEETK